MKFSEKQMQKFGENHLKKFYQKLEEITKKNKFDIIVGAGNTGVAMAKLTKIYFQYKKKKCPKVVKIPFYRSWDEPDLEYLEKKTKKLLPKRKIKKVLFVDDEIGKGETFRGAMAILRNAIKNKERLEVYLIAETKGLKKRHLVKDCQVHFRPFDKRIAAKTYNVITYCVPLKINGLLKKHILDLEQSKLFNILLGEPLKQIRNHKPYFSFKKGNEGEVQIKNFKELQKEFVEYIKRLI